MDLSENLPKWQAVLKNSTSIADNKFLLYDDIQYYIKFSPKEGIIDIEIELAKEHY